MPMATQRAFRILTVSLVFVLACRSQAQQHVAESRQQERAVRQFLEKVYLEDLRHDPDIEYIDEFIDLNGDGKQEALTYVTGRYICGTSGCSTFILTPVGADYKLVAEISIANFPIRVLNSSSQGWRDLEVTVRGGGIRTAYRAELHYDGKTYPENPTVPPARPTDGKSPGRVLFQSSQWKKVGSK
jgi:hypothetical protein